MQKSYNIKVYNLAGTLQRVLNPEILMSSISFSQDLNAWQGELRLKLKLDFSTTSIAYNNIIKVTEIDDENAVGGRVIYSGIVGNIKRIIDSKGEYIEVRVIGLASMLTWFYFYQSASYSFTKNQALSTTIKDIIDYFSTKYPGLLSYTVPSIDSYWTANVSFAYDKCFDALKKCVDITGYWWRIGGDGVLHFHQTSSTHHKLTLGSNIESIEVEENSEKIVNKYLVDYSWGWSPYIASDATSQTDNGIRELHESKTTELNDLSTATIAGDAYIAQNKNSKSRIVIIVTNEYDIESINPGDLMSVRNTDYSINALKVVRTEYSMDRIRVELEEKRSFTQEVFT